MSFWKGVMLAVQEDEQLAENQRDRDFSLKTMREQFEENRKAALADREWQAGQADLQRQHDLGIWEADWIRTQEENTRQAEAAARAAEEQHKRAIELARLGSSLTVDQIREQGNVDLRVESTLAEIDASIQEELVNLNQEHSLELTQVQFENAIEQARQEQDWQDKTAEEKQEHLKEMLNLETEADLTLLLTEYDEKLAHQREAQVFTAGENEKDRGSREGIAELEVDLARELADTQHKQAKELRVIDFVEAREVVRNDQAFRDKTAEEQHKRTIEILGLTEDSEIAVLAKKFLYQYDLQQDAQDFLSRENEQDRFSREYIADQNNSAAATLLRDKLEFQRTMQEDAQEEERYLMMLELTRSPLSDGTKTEIASSYAALEGMLEGQEGAEDLLLAIHNQPGLAVDIMETIEKAQKFNAEKGFPHHISPEMIVDAFRVHGAEGLKDVEQLRATMPDPSDADAVTSFMQRPQAQVGVSTDFSPLYGTQRANEQEKKEDTSTFKDQNAAFKNAVARKAEAYWEELNAKEAAGENTGDDLSAQILFDMINKFRDDSDMTSTDSQKILDRFGQEAYQEISQSQSSVFTSIENNPFFDRFRNTVVVTEGSPAHRAGHAVGTVLRKKSN